MQRLSLAAIGILAVAIGIVFTLQGTNVLGGSAMSGHAFWAVVGVILIVVGLGLIGTAARQGRRSRP